MSDQVGFSDRNIIAMARITKVPKAGPKVIYKRVYKAFCEHLFEDMNKVLWNDVIESTGAEAALELFMKRFISVCDKYAPIRKRSVRTVTSPWLDSELRTYRKERDEVKNTATKSGSLVDWHLAGLPFTQK